MVQLECSRWKVEGPSRVKVCDSSPNDPGNRAEYDHQQPIRHASHHIHTTISQADCKDARQNGDERSMCDHHLATKRTCNSGPKMELLSSYYSLQRWEYESCILCDTDATGS